LGDFSRPSRISITIYICLNVATYAVKEITVMPARSRFAARVCRSRVVLGALACLIAGMLLPSAWADGKPKDAPPPAAATTATGAPRSDYRFAVKEFRVDSSIVYPGWYGFQDGLNNAVCDMLTTEMSKQGRDMVERSRLKDVTDEQDLGNSGRLEKSTAAPIGHILGADYLILGSITEWGMKTRSIGGGGLLGGMFGGARLSDVTARVKIDYHVVNARTGRIVAGSAGTAMGEDSNKGVALDNNWYNHIDFSESEWTSSQIGKATRKAVQQIASQLSAWNPNDGGAEPDRTPLKASVVALVSPTEFVIDKGQSDDVRVGDTVDVIQFNAIKNATGRVVYQTETKIGTAVVVEVQDGGAKLHFLSSAPTAKLKEGDGVRTPAPAGP
jgi:curli biogenesis system outer membrane secretion channel CsgG